MPTSVEPYDIQRLHHRRPDLEFTLTNASVTTDISVINPCALTYRRNAAKTPLYAAVRRKGKKLTLPHLC